MTTKLSTSGRSTTNRWIKISGPEADYNSTVDVRMASDEESHVHKSLVSYCGWLVEEKDEEMTQGLMTGSMTDSASVLEFICANMTKSCPGVFICNPAKVEMTS